MEIILVPLIGLGHNEVEKEIVIKHNANAYHVDEHKYQDAKNLRDRMSDFLVKFWSGQHIFTSTARIRILMDTQYTSTPSHKHTQTLLAVQLTCR